MYIKESHDWVDHHRTAQTTEHRNMKIGGGDNS